MKKLSHIIAEGYVNRENVVNVNEMNIDAVPSKPTPLNKIDSRESKEAVKSGYKKGELNKPEVSAKKVTIECKKLKASQTEIVVTNAVGFAINVMLRATPIQVGGDLGSIISKDNYIMDGHHRWCASYLIDPNSSVTATQIDLDGGKLVNVLNVITKGRFDRNGNNGKGNIKDFSGKKVGEVIDDFIKNGIGGDYPLSAEKVKEFLGKMPNCKGDYELGRAKMMDNADKLPKNILPFAPPRIGMPVISPDEVDEVVNMLKIGSVDYAKVKY